jgi:hypothetical protein
MPTKADVVVENGWGVGPNHSHAIIGVFAQTEKGEVFLTEYLRETAAAAFGPDDEDVCIESASLMPEEFEQLKRMAAAVGVRMADHRKGSRLVVPSTPGKVVGYRRGKSRAN